MVAIVVCCDVYLQRGRYRPSHDLGAEYLAIMSLAGSEGEKLFFPPADDGYGDSIDLAMVRRYLQPTSELEFIAEVARLRAAARRLRRRIRAFPLTRMAITIFH